MSTTRLTPYELLVRWGEDGILRGAHAQYLTVITLDDDSIVRKLGDTMPIEIGKTVGFPLKDILNTVHVDALAKCEQLQAELAAVSSEFQAARENLDAANATIAQLQKTLTAAGE